MMNLTAIERRACEILLAAVHLGASVNEFRDALQRERIYSRTWGPMWKALRLVAVLDEPLKVGDCDSECRRVRSIDPTNVVAFVPRAEKPSSRRYGGNAA